MKNIETLRKLWSKYIWIFRDFEEDWELDFQADSTEPENVAAARKAAAQDLFLRLDRRSATWEGNVAFTDPYLHDMRLAWVQIIDLGRALVAVVNDPDGKRSPTETLILILPHAEEGPSETGLREVLSFLRASDVAKVIQAVAERPEPEGSSPYLIELVLKVAYPEDKLALAYSVGWTLIEAMLRFAGACEL
jgi:hypothetical protein